MTGGLVFLFAISAIGVIIPLYLIVIQCIDVQIWPENPFLPSAFWLYFTFFKERNAFKHHINKKRSWKESFRLSWTARCALLKYVNNDWNNLSLFERNTDITIKYVNRFLYISNLSSRSIPLFPSGLRAKFQFQIFCFSLSYVLFYELTGSFMLTFVLQHLIATTTFIYNQDYEFGRRDFPYYFGIFIVAPAIIFCSIWLRWLLNFFAFLAILGNSVFVLVPLGIIALKDVAST